MARHLAAIDLELSADGSFKLRDVANYGGSWVQTGSGVDLRVETILNRPIEQQQESVQKSFKFDVRVENGRMFYKNLGDTQELELKKELKP